MGGGKLPYFVLCPMVYSCKQKISSSQVSENSHLGYDWLLQMFGSVTARRSWSFWTPFSCGEEGGGSYHPCSSNLAQCASLLPETLPDLLDTTPCHGLTQSHFLIEILRHRAGCALEGMEREETSRRGEVWVSRHRKQQRRSNIQKLVDRRLTYGQEVHRRGKVKLWTGGP